MFKIILYLFFAIAFSSCSSPQTKAMFLQKLHNQPNISYKTVAQKVEAFSDEDAFKEECQSSYDSNETAIELNKTTKEQIVQFTQDYGVVVYSVDDSKFGLLFDKNAILQDVVLLEASHGNNEWQIQRRTVVHPKKNILFLVSEKYYNTEWIIPGVKGKRVLTDKKTYIINVSKNLRFSVHST